MVYITHIRLAGGTGHEHITHVRWINRADNEQGTSPTLVMVDWIDNKKGQAKVSDGRREVDVAVVHASPPHLRTVADGVWTDNLLALPRF